MRAFQKLVRDELPALVVVFALCAVAIFYKEEIRAFVLSWR